MIDIQLLREQPDLLKQKTIEKRVAVDVDAAIALDKEYRSLLGQVESLRQSRNVITEKMKGGKPDEQLIAEGKQIKVELADRESLLDKTQEELTRLLSKIPNPHFNDVPVGGEDASVEIRRFGDCEKTGAKDHLDIAAERGWIDFERGAKVAGAKFYFLKDELALLENGLIQYGIEVARSEGFRFMTVPHMVNSRTATGTGFAPRSDDQSDEYYIEGEDLSLIATAEMPLTGYHADEILPESELPLLYAGLSPCYRKEAGTYGKHTRGLFRVHQFNKLEMYAFCLPEQSAEMHEKILAIEEKIWQTLGIPYHVINIASGDLGAPAAKKYDIEYWSPVDGMFRELTSCSNCTDFQARNLNIRVKRTNGRTELVHTLNGTAISTARTLVAILENFQTENGTIRIPEPLRIYMQGKEVL